MPIFGSTLSASCSTTLEHATVFKILIHLVYKYRNSILSYRRTEADEVVYDLIGGLQYCKVLNFCLLSPRADPKQMDPLSSLHVLDVYLASTVSFFSPGLFSTTYVCLQFCKLNRYSFPCSKPIGIYSIPVFKMPLKTRPKLTEANDIFV